MIEGALNFLLISGGRLEHIHGRASCQYQLGSYISVTVGQGPRRRGLGALAPALLSQWAFGPL